MHARRPRSRTAALVVAVAASAALAACGEDDDQATTETGQAAPPATEFPAAAGRTLEQIGAEAAPGDDLVISPAGAVFSEGRNRFPFGLFTLEREQITDAEVAVYAAPGASGKASGPYPARIESLATEPAFVAQTTHPDDAKAVYLSDVPFDRPGEWRLLALVRQEDGLAAVRMPSVKVSGDDPIPAPGERAPVVHTPTEEDVGGDLAQIDTRVPPSTMHGQDLADVIGEQPVVLVFATPALCQSRVCGPVVDVVEQVKRDVGDDAAFIHMEIWKDNDLNKGLRPQVRAYNLPTEPWMFVIDRDGRVSTRIEGAFSVDELTEAVERVTG